MKTASEFLADFEKRKGEPEIIGDCPLCQKPIVLCPGSHPDETWQWTYNGRKVHEDCYYEVLGEHVEGHPIVPMNLPRSGPDAT